VNKKHELLSALIAAAKPAPDILLKPGKGKEGFYVRMGTVALCRWMLGCSEPCAVLFHALLELWVEAKDKIVRIHNGEARRFLYLSGDDLATLTGRDKKTLQNTIIRELREKPFVLIEQAKLTPDKPKGYRISIDTNALWQEIAFELQPVKETVQQVDGHAFVKKRIDRAKLPYVFKRLYDDFVHENGEFSP
jgi:hypothetical protein